MSEDVADGRVLARSLQERWSIGRKLRVGAEVFGLYVRVRIALRRLPLPELLAQLRGPMSARPAVTVEDQVVGIRLGRAVSRALAPLPFDSRCLVRSLVLAAMLSRREIDARVIIGVEPGPDFTAHAWVESDGLSLLPVDRERYHRIAEL